MGATGWDRVVELIGAEAAARLQVAYNGGRGGRLYIPVVASLHSGRDAAILADHRNGWTVQELAAHYGVSRRTVYRALEVAE